MTDQKIAQMKKAHRVQLEFPFVVKELYHGYSDRILRIDLDRNEINILPVTQQMKDLWTGGKGFDLWLMFQEISKDTKWDSPENPICFSPGPLGGTTSFPGSGKTLVTSLSPQTFSVMDCNVGGYFGPYMKFAGFDALVIIGKAREETIIYIDAVSQKITIETAPEESVDSHLIAEELTEMYADDDYDKRNIAVVSAGQASQYIRMGVLNFSFWDWRRNVARLKQAGRGGIGTVFRNKKLKALVIKNRDITPAWRVQENKVAKGVRPKKMAALCEADLDGVNAISDKWGNDPAFIVEIMQDVQERFQFIADSALDRLTQRTGVPKSYIYHIATFDPFFSLEKKKKQAAKKIKPVKILSRGDAVVLAENDPADFITFRKILAEKNPEKIIGEIKESGLRSRTCGMPVGPKWETARRAVAEKKQAAVVVLNAAEARSEAPVSRTLLENRPNALIEAMLISAYAVGASKGYVVIWKEHEQAAAGLAEAIAAARKAGFVGTAIPGTDLNFDIQIHRLGGAFVPGEPTSLLQTMSGRAGDSRARYIPIEEAGFIDQPTIVLNPETIINVPAIMQKGGRWFKKLGTAESPGTKVFSLSGGFRKSGLLEAPLGITLRDILSMGGVKDETGIRAVRVGGLSGWYFPVSQLDTPINLDSLQLNLGTGEIELLTDPACLVDHLFQAIRRLADDSCGKCTPCREGLFAATNILGKIRQGKGDPGDVPLLEAITDTLRDTSLCNFGAAAANPLQSALKYFRDELVNHAREKACGCTAGETKSGKEN